MFFIRQSDRLFLHIFQPYGNTNKKYWRTLMKADKDKSTNTIPKGVWESSRPDNDKDKSKCSVTTDLQGNGYPQKQGK